MGQQEYNEHYDTTTAKGLCWEGCGRPQAVSTLKIGGELWEVESLWCVECQIKEGWIQSNEYETTNH